MQPTTHIRSAQESDALSIAKIHVKSWQKTYRSYIPDSVLDNLSINEKEQTWRDLIRNNVKILVIEKNREIVGFVSLSASRDEDTNQTSCGEITAIYLDPACYRQGFGKRLCQRALLELKKMNFNEVILWVLKDNHQARKFYEHIGFHLTDKIKTIKFNEKVSLEEVRYQLNLS